VATASPQTHSSVAKPFDRHHLPCIHTVHAPKRSRHLRFERSSGTVDVSILVESTRVMSLPGALARSRPGSPGDTDQVHVVSSRRGRRGSLGGEILRATLRCGGPTPWARPVSSCATATAWRGNVAGCHEPGRRCLHCVHSRYVLHTYCTGQAGESQCLKVTITLQFLEFTALGAASSEGRASADCTWITGSRDATLHSAERGSQGAKMPRQSRLAGRRNVQRRLTGGAPLLP